MATPDVTANPWSPNLMDMIAWGGGFGGSGFDPSLYMDPRKRMQMQMGQSLMQGGMDASPLRSPFQGLAKLAGVLVGGGMAKGAYGGSQQSPFESLFSSSGGATQAQVQDPAANQKMFDAYRALMTPKLQALWDTYTAPQKLSVIAQDKDAFKSQTSLAGQEKQVGGLLPDPVQRAVYAFNQLPPEQKTQAQAQALGKTLYGEGFQPVWNADGTMTAVAIPGTGADPRYQYTSTQAKANAGVEAATAIQAAKPFQPEPGKPVTTPANLGVGTTNLGPGGGVAAPAGGSAATGAATAPPATGGAPATTPATPQTPLPASPAVAGTLPPPTPPAAPPSQTAAPPAAPPAAVPPAAVPPATPVPPLAPITTTPLAPPPYGVTAQAPATPPATPPYGTPPKVTSRYGLVGPSKDPNVVDPMLNQIAQRESGFNGQNFAQANIPSKLNEDSSGIYQISQATWKDYGDPRYKRAMDAPPEVQRDAARRIFAARGEQPWLGSNPTYLAAHRQGAPSAATAPGPAPQTQGAVPATPDKNVQPVLPPAGGAADLAASVAAEPPPGAIAGGDLRMAGAAGTGGAQAGGSITAPAPTPPAAAPTATPPLKSEAGFSRNFDPTQPLRDAGPNYGPNNPYHGPGDVTQTAAGPMVGADPSVKPIVDEAQKTYETNTAKYQTAQSAFQHMDVMQHDLDELNKNPNAPNTGRTFELRQEVAGIWNDIAHKLDPSGTVLKGFDPAALASGESFMKESNNMAQQVGGAIHATDNTIEGAYHGVPNVALSDKGNRFVLQVLKQTYNRDRDLHLFQNAWMTDPNNPGHVLVGSEEAFNKAHPIGDYMKQAYYNVIPSGAVSELAAAAAANGGKIPADHKASFDKHFGNGMAEFALWQAQQQVMPGQR